MFCAKCGTKIQEGARFCGRCGKPVAENPIAKNSTVENPKANNPEANNPEAKKPEKKAEEKNPAAEKVMPGKPEVIKPVTGKTDKKPKRKWGKKKWFAIGAVAAVFVIILLVRGGGNSGNKWNGMKNLADLQEWDVEIKNDVQAAYYHDFVNLIPFYEDVPYVSVSGNGLYPDIRYNWLSMTQSRWGQQLPYEGLRTAYSYVLSDIYVLNGRPEKELEMAQYFYCNNSVSTLNGVNLDADAWNEYDGLLWYMTFLNYQCNIETEENEYGTLVHVKITNTDMVKLLYEELENTYNMVKEDNAQAASERFNGAFNKVKTYFRNEAENLSRVDHLEITRPVPGMLEVSTVYGNSLVSKLNLIELAGGLIYEQAKYQGNRQFWGNLSDDGTLYHYTLSNMLLRMTQGDCDIVNTEVTFYADVDSRGNGFIPFDKRTNFTSFVKADQDWDTLVDVLKSKGLAASNCSMGNIQQGDPIFTWGLSSDHDYENMLLWVIMGWRGSIVKGQPVTERADSLGYVGKVEAVAADAGGLGVPKEVIEGKSVLADRDPATGLYEVDGVLYEINGGEAKAVGMVEGFDLTELTLPKEINDCPLTVLGECSIYNCESLVSLAIPEGVRILEKNAVASNENLVSVSLPSTLTEIGIGAFILDVSLKEIEIPYGVTVIEQGAFISCFELEELMLPDSVERIGDSAFDNCTSLHIWVPTTAKCGQYAFRSVVEVNYR